MSRNALYGDDQCRCLGYETAKLFGMPHMNARYKNSSVKSHTWDGDFPMCAVCGRTHGIFEVHHEPPRSKGLFVLETPMGKHVLRPALATLCKDCHSDRHDRGTLKFTWEWDSEEFEKLWWDGTFLKAHPPHGRWLWAYGRYLITRDGITWEYRGEATAFGAYMAELDRRAFEFSKLHEEAMERIGWTGGIDG